MRRFLCFILITQWLGGASPVADPRRAEGRKTSPRAPEADRWVGVIGDSGVTGAASSPELTANLFTLLSTLRFALGDRPAFVPPGSEPATRVASTAAERADLNLAQRRGEAALGARLVDVPEHAFAYLAARALGVSGADVVTAAQDGTRVETIPAQLARLFESGRATLPPIVFVSFTANDFCDARALEDSVEARAARFRRSLAEAWAAAAPSLKAHRLGTRFVVLKPFDVGHALTQPDLLAQRVPLGLYGSVQCGAMHEGRIAYGPVAEVEARKLVAMCPSVLGTKPGDLARVRRLGEIQRSFDLAWRDQIRRLNRAHARDGLSWDYVTDLDHVRFTTGDLANDCFHPGASGHRKVAALVLDHLRRTLTLPSAADVHLLTANGAAE